MKRFTALILMVALFIACFAGCGEKNEDGVDTSGKIKVVITMETGDEIELELYPKVAPITVENFVNLCNEKFYDGVIFHRIIPGFMIQGGDNDGDGIGGSDKAIKGEFASNGFENNLKHERGVISMARTNDPNSATSQFFIMHDVAEHLDGEYAAFGKVTKGMDVVDKIAAVETGAGDRPINPPVIKSIRIIK